MGIPARKPRQKPGYLTAKKRIRDMGVRSALSSAMDKKRKRATIPQRKLQAGLQIAAKKPKKIVLIKKRIRKRSKLSRWAYDKGKIIFVRKK